MKKHFVDVPVKNKEEAHQKIMTISKNNDYTTGNFLVILFKTLQINCNRFKQPNWIRKS